MLCKFCRSLNWNSFRIWASIQFSDERTIEKDWKRNRERRYVEFKSKLQKFLVSFLKARLDRFSNSVSFVIRAGENKNIEPRNLVIVAWLWIWKHGFEKKTMMMITINYVYQADIGETKTVWMARKGKWQYVVRIRMAAGVIIWGTILQTHFLLPS